MDERRPGGYFNALDGLRAATCAGVVISHSFPHSRLAGRFGVECVSVFFALSGFLITTLLLEEKAARGRIDLLAFYARRTLRIWPVYFAAIAVTAAGALIFGERFLRPLGYQGSAAELMGNLPLYAVFLGNWSLGRVTTSVQILWSVSVEEQFYLVFPLIFVVLRARNSVFWIAAVGTILCLFARTAFIVTGRVEGLEYNSFSHGEHLLFGAVLAQWVHSFPDSARRIRSSLRPALVQAVLLVLCGGFVALIAALPERDGLASGLLRFPFSAALATALVALFAFGEGPMVSLASRPLPRYLGQLTYSAYVFHILPLAAVWSIVDELPLGRAGTLLRVLLSIPAAFVAAFIVRHAFEKRINDLRGRFRPGSAQQEVTIPQPRAR